MIISGCFDRARGEKSVQAPGARVQAQRGAARRRVARAESLARRGYMAVAWRGPASGATRSIAHEITPKL